MVSLLLNVVLTKICLVNLYNQALKIRQIIV